VYYATKQQRETGSRKDAQKAQREKQRTIADKNKQRLFL
jgi:hypothetical protein